jgi:cell division septation protein DedD
MLSANRQLLSGFFVIALLLGMAFARGYLVGRNSIPSPKGSPPVPSAPAGLTEPKPGTYWQVMTSTQSQAEVFARVLQQEGFRVSLSPGTKKLTRVLVGPYPDRESQGRAKSDLEASGFHPVILKRE